MHQQGSSTRNAAGDFRPIRTPLNTPALNAVVVAVMDDGGQKIEKPSTSGGRLRSAKLAAIVASGLLVGGLGFLGSRGDLKTVASVALHIGGLNTIRYAEAALDRSAAPQRESQAQERDAEWTPPPLNAKPWAPTPYTPIELPSTAFASGGPLPAATFFVPPVLSAAPTTAPAPVAPPATQVGTKKSKTKKHAT